MDGPAETDAAAASDVLLLLCCCPADEEVAVLTSGMGGGSSTSGSSSSCAAVPAGCWLLPVGKMVDDELLSAEPVVAPVSTALAANSTLSLLPMSNAVVVVSAAVPGGS